MSSNEDDLKKGKRPCYRTLKEYSSASTTHGIAYVFEDDRLVLERVLWIIVIIIAIFFAALFSINAYTNWQDEPVLTSIFDGSSIKFKFSMLGGFGASVLISEDNVVVVPGFGVRVEIEGESSQTVV